MCVIPALRRLRQEVQMFKVMSIYIVLEACLEYLRPYLREGEREGGRDGGRHGGTEGQREEKTGNWIECKNRHL